MPVVHVKNMVCHRCVMVVESILNKAAIPFGKIDIGEITLKNDLTANERKDLQTGLRTAGFEIVDSRSNVLVEKAKQLIIKKARNEVSEKDKKITLSSYLTSHLNYDYSHLSNIFSSVESRTIENFFISHRLEMVKELLIYDELTLSEIAFQLDYSSVAHLSAQFKKVTGLTPSWFKKIGEERKGLDKV